jgi:hypothetical protein
MWLIWILFALAALVGLTMAVAAWRGRFPPVMSAVLHGALALGALVLLSIAVTAQGARGAGFWALICLTLAALGGLTLAFNFHARRQPLPKGFVAGHATLALLGLLLLLAKLVWLAK